MSAGAPAGLPARWVETRKEGVWLGKVKDFAGHEAAAFGLRESGKVLYLDLELEKPSGGEEFVPAPRVGALDISAPPGTAGTIRYYSIQFRGDRELGVFPGRRGTYLGFEPSASGGPVRLALDALALIAAGDYRKALPSASPEECFEAVRALFWSRQRDLLKESLQTRPSILGEYPDAEWQARFFAGGLQALTALPVPEGSGDLAILNRAAAEWLRRPSPQAATAALAAAVGSDFTCWEFAPPQPSSGHRRLEGFVEARYGPFHIESIRWWDLVSEVEPKFATDVLSQLHDAVGEVDVWIESADPRSGRIAAIDHPEWTLAEGVSIPDGIGFGSRVSVISRHEGRTILALKLQRQEPQVLALQLLKEAKSGDIGRLARERAAGRPGLTSDWAKFVESLEAFDHLEALEVCRDPAFLEELEALLPRTLKEARYRSDTESIKQPILIVLGWIAAASYDRARDLLERTPRLIRTHGVAYGDDLKLSPYQESLIVHARWLADRLEKPGAAHPPEPEYAGSDIHEWMDRLGLTPR